MLGSVIALKMRIMRISAFDEALENHEISEV
jgi:hypothetical protein